MSAFLFFTHLPSLQGIRKPPWSLWLNLCLNFTARLRDLTDNCMCGVQRWVSHSKIMLNTIIGVSPCNILCDLLSKFLILNLFRLAITKGLITYWLKTFQLFISDEFVNIYLKHNSTLTLWGITHHLNLIKHIFNLFWSCLIAATPQRAREAKVESCVLQNMTRQIALNTGLLNLEAPMCRRKHRSTDARGQPAGYRPIRISC